MYLKKEDLKKLVTAAGLVGGINALNSVEGYASSTELSRRKSKLRTKLRALVTGEEKEETKINIEIEIPEEKKEPKKTFKFNLKDLLSGKPKKDEDDDETTVVLRGLWPEEELGVVGKIVREL